MHIEIKSTRRTRIGTLRRGSIRLVDPKNPHVTAAIKPMVESGAAVILTDDEVKAHRGAVESLEVPAHLDAAASPGDVAADMAAALSDAIARAEAAETALADEIAEFEGRLAIATDETAAALARAEAAEEKLTKEDLAEVKLAEAKLAEAKLAEEKLAEEKLAEAKPATDAGKGKK